MKSVENGGARPPVDIERRGEVFINMWDFSTDPELQQKLDWTESFMSAYVDPLDLLYPDQAFDPPPTIRPLIGGLKEMVKEADLWAYHLPPSLGGQGYGQVSLCLLNEILGRSWGYHAIGWGPVLFGTQGPDTGNAEIIAEYGTPQQKEQYLQPLLNGEIFSSFSMTEPQGGADPGVFTTTATRDGDEWVITGEKWFTSHAIYSDFIIVMAVTNRETSVHKGSSMFLVPRSNPGLEFVRNIGTNTEPIGEGIHAYLRYNDVRVPAENLLGPEGDGFKIAQTRLSGGRLQHAMRTIAVCRQAFDMMQERVISRTTQGSLLADKQMVQRSIADTYMDLEQFRLFVLQAAWLADCHGWKHCRKEVAATKILASRLLPTIIGRAMQIHGSLGMSNETQLTRMWSHAPWMGVMDGPSEVHLMTIARDVLRGHEPAPDMFPSYHLPRITADARVRIDEYVKEFEKSGRLQIPSQSARRSGADG